MSKKVEQFNPAESAVIKQWQDGEISLGKAAELLYLDKNELRCLLSGMGLAIIDYPVEDVTAEVEWLLYG